MNVAWKKILSIIALLFFFNGMIFLEWVRVFGALGLALLIALDDEK